MAISMASTKLKFSHILTSSASIKRRFLNPARRITLCQTQEQKIHSCSIIERGVYICKEILCQHQTNTNPYCLTWKDDIGIVCEPCNGKGWLLCDFCEGQKINVKSENNRIYRRCPTCRAIGYILCSKCKVFKCVTFPNYNDGEL